MTRIRIVLILTENWTMRPAPDVADLVTFAVEAERAGLDAVMVSEHVVLGPSADAAGLPANPRDYALPGNQDPATPWPSPLVLLSAIAAVTTRIRLVAGALISPLRHPLATAKDLATLDRLSGGRLVVQPTVGWHRDEYAALGVPFGQRGEILDEQLEIWAKAWGGSPVSHDGKHYSFGTIWVEPQHPAPVVRTCGSAVRACTPADRPPGPVRKRLQPARPGRGPAPLAAAMTAAGRQPDELEYVGGTRGAFRGPDAVADLDQALSAVPAQVAGGFATICVKPSQFIDDTAAIGAFCRSLAARAASLGES